MVEDDNGDATGLTPRSDGGSDEQMSLFKDWLNSQEKNYKIRTKEIELQTRQLEVDKEGQDQAFSYSRDALQLHAADRRELRHADGRRYRVRSAQLVIHRRPELRRAL